MESHLIELMAKAEKEAMERSVERMNQMLDEVLNDHGK